MSPQTSDCHPGCSLDPSQKFSLSLIDKVLADRKCVDPDGAVFVLESESDAETDVDGFDRENFH